MNRLLLCSVLVLCCAATARSADDELLWDNGLIYPCNCGRAISPPSWPNIRVADDFQVRDDAWLLRRVETTVIEDTGWRHGGEIQLFIYADSGSRTPARLLQESRSPFLRFATGNYYFGRAEYRYTLDPLAVFVPEGSYWTGPRNPLGAGGGTNYWEGGDGRDGRNSSTGFFSLNGGQTWSAEGFGWHHAFEFWGLRGRLSATQAFRVIRGEHVTGGVISLSASDDQYLVIESRHQTSVSQPSVQIEVEGVAHLDAPDALGLIVEASVTAEDLLQWVDFFDFEDQRWVRVDERPAPTDDARSDVIAQQLPKRFVQADTGVVRARVAFYDPGIDVAGWSGRFDHVYWAVFPN
jgi:hypothetical protein